MNHKTRKHIWPVALMSLTVFGVLAVVVALSVIQPQAALADGCDQITDPIAKAQCDARHRDAGLDYTDATHSHPGNGGNGGNGNGANVFTGYEIKSSSTSANSTVELKVILASLPQELVVGSSVELYLEDDYQVPPSIASNTVYFIANGGERRRQAQHW